MVQERIRPQHKIMIGLYSIFAFLLASCLSPLAAAPDDVKFAELVREARIEGKLTFYTSLTAAQTVTFVERFQKKYPFLKVDPYRLSNTQLLTRLVAEQRAKRNTVDVITSKGDAIYFMKKNSFLGRYPSPEREFYAEGFKDREGYWTDTYPTVHCVVYNTRIVAPHEVPATYQDLLKPKWKGKIGINRNNYMWSEVVMQIMGKEEGLKFLEALSRQNPIMRDGGTLNIMLTAAGEVAMAVSVNINLVEDMKAQGAPVDWARIKPYYGDLHPIALAANAPHPNAGKLFIDYLLSQEGQELMLELGLFPARKGLNSKVLRSEDITSLDPALGENIAYYQKMMKQLFSKRN